MGRIAWLGSVALLTMTAIGCGQRPPTQAPAAISEVIVSLPVVKEITEYEDFTGRTESMADVTIRARVTGYLDQVLFKEGTEVKQGDMLFVIDPRPYEAALNKAEALVLESKARLERLESTFRRATALLPQNAISQDDYETIKGDRDAAVALLKSMEATRDLAKLNLSYTKVTAPISGRIGRQLVDPGNLVQGDTATPTALTTVVAIDPIYAYFYVDERTVLRLRRLVEAGVIKKSLEASMPVSLALLDEKGFPHEGTINFVDNRDDANSGTLLLRGIFPNSNRMLSPGLFARVRLPIGKPHQAILISEQALGSDQGQHFVYVVNDQSEAVYRRVTVGALHDGLRVVEEGLAPEDRVVVNGLQRVRPGAKVAAKMLDTAAETAGAAPSSKPASPATSSPLASPAPSSASGNRPSS